MDFKELMTKLEKIEKKQILNESVTNSVKKRAKIKINENLDMKGSIAKALMQEFGIQEAEEDDKSTGDDARPETGNEPGGTQQSAPQAQDEFDGVDSAIGQQATQSAADANPEVYGYGGGQEPTQAAQQPAAGSQGDDAFQQANQEPAQDDPAQGGDAIGQAQAATQPSAVPTTPAKPAAPAQPAAAPATAPAAAARPPVTPAPGEGPTGVALAKFGVSKQDRLNQKFVDSILGPGKFKAGSAQANTALLAHFQKQAPTAAVKPAVAAPAAAPAGVVQGGSSVEENLNLIRKLAGL